MRNPQKLFLFRRGLAVGGRGSPPHSTPPGRAEEGAPVASATVIRTRTSAPERYPRPRPRPRRSSAPPNPRAGEGSPQTLKTHPPPGRERTADLPGPISQCNSVREREDATLSFISVERRRETPAPSGGPRGCGGGGDARRARLAPAAQSGRPLAGQGRVKVTAEDGPLRPGCPRSPAPAATAPSPGPPGFPGSRSRTAGRAGSPQGRRLRLQSRCPSRESGEPRLAAGAGENFGGCCGEGCGSAACGVSKSSGAGMLLRLLAQG